MNIRARLKQEAQLLAEILLTAPQLYEKLHLKRLAIAQ